MGKNGHARGHAHDTFKLGNLFFGRSIGYPLKTA